jgi:tyrosine-protein kinase Etk/Wzc
MADNDFDQSPVPGHQLPPAATEHSSTGGRHQSSPQSSALSYGRSPVSSEAGPESSQADDEISLLDIAIVLAKHKKLILGLPFLAAVITAGITLLMPNWYTATAKILPPQQGQSNAVAILGQLGALSGGVGSALGVKNPSDIFVAMLKSRTVADGLIQKFDLQKIYDMKLITDARKALKDNTVITAGKDGVITVEFEDKDPKRAADVTNGYVAELEALTLNLAVSEAAQRRLFFERQLTKAKEDLARAEIELQKLQEKTGIINPSGQASLSVAAAAGLRAQITAKEVQLGTLRSFATDLNPDLIRTEKELEALRVQMAKTGKASEEKGDVLVGIGKVPGASVEFIKKYRDVKYYETLFELLAKQYEIAKIDEAKEATLIQILDTAVRPERKTKPSRSKIVVLTAIIGLLLAGSLAFVLEKLERMNRQPELANRWANLRGLMSLR